MVGFQPQTGFPAEVVGAAHPQWPRQPAEILPTDRGLPIQKQHTQISRTGGKQQLGLKLPGFPKQSSGGVDRIPLVTHATRLSEVAQVVRLGDYMDSYVPPRRTGVSLDDAAAAVREV